VKKQQQMDMPTQQLRAIKSTSKCNQRVKNHA